MGIAISVIFLSSEEGRRQMCASTIQEARIVNCSGRQWCHALCDGLHWPLAYFFFYIPKRNTIISSCPEKPRHVSMCTTSTLIGDAVPPIRSRNRSRGCEGLWIAKKKRNKNLIKRNLKRGQGTKRPRGSHTKTSMASRNRIWDKDCQIRICKKQLFVLLYSKRRVIQSNAEMSGDLGSATRLTGRFSLSVQQYICNVVILARVSHDPDMAIQIYSPSFFVSSFFNTKLNQGSPDLPLPLCRPLPFRASGLF